MQRKELILILMLCVSAPAQSSSCSNFLQLAKETITKYQYNSPVTFEPSSLIERDMKTSASHYARYRTEKWRNKSIDLFMKDWSRACKKGWYGTID